MAKNMVKFHPNFHLNSIYQKYLKIYYQTLTYFVRKIMVDLLFFCSSLLMHFITPQSISYNIMYVSYKIVTFSSLKGKILSKKFKRTYQKEN